MRRRLAFFFLLLLVTAGCDRIDNTEHANGIRRTVARTPQWVDAATPVGRRVWTIERAFYEARGYMPAWIDGTRPTPQMAALVEELRAAATHGLDPAHYGLDRAPRQARVESGDKSAS